MGVVIMALELVHISKRLFCNDITQGYQAAEIWYHRATILPSKLYLTGRGPSWASKCVRVKITVPMGLGLGIVAWGQGLWPGGPRALSRTRGWGLWVALQGQGPRPTGLGTSNRIVIFWNNLYFFGNVTGLHSMIGVSS